MPRMRLLLLLVLCLPWARPRAATLDLFYRGTLAGVAVVAVDCVLDQTASGYTLHVGLRTVGVFGRLVRGRSDIIAQGVWRDGGAASTHLDSEGVWNGRPRRLVIDYVGGAPVMRVMVPPRPLPPAAAAGAIDGLGATVGLMHIVAATGHCGLHARVFDGHGLTQFDATDGAVAMRCDFTTRKLAGDPARVDHGYALFRALPGLPPVPVRIVFERRWLGDAVLQLTGSGDPKPADGG